MARFKNSLKENVLKSNKLEGQDFLLHIRGQLGSMSPAFYARLFLTKVLSKAFLCLKYRLNFWSKEIGANALIKCL